MAYLYILFYMAIQHNIAFCAKKNLDLLHNTLSLFAPLILKSSFVLLVSLAIVRYEWWISDLLDLLALIQLSLALP